MSLHSGIRCTLLLELALAPAPAALPPLPGVLLVRLLLVLLVVVVLLLFVLLLAPHSEPASPKSEKVIGRFGAELEPAPEPEPEPDPQNDSDDDDGPPSAGRRACRDEK